jgi:hypothetical protein
MRSSWVVDLRVVDYTLLHGYPIESLQKCE